MFDGRSTVPLRWDGPGVVLDLSAVPLDSEALPLVMVATAGWFRQLMACPGPQRIQVLDEAWALLGNRHTAGYRAVGVLSAAYGDEAAAVALARLPQPLVLAFDADDAGRAASDRLTALLAARDRSPSILDLGSGDLNDPMRRSDEWPGDLSRRVAGARAQLAKVIAR